MKPPHSKNITMFPVYLKGARCMYVCAFITPDKEKV